MPCHVITMMTHHTDFLFHLSDPASREGHPRKYSLRHALTHACMAKDGPAARRLALKARQWQSMFEEGEMWQM
jgi:hypothetical protein